MTIYAHGRKACNRKVARIRGAGHLGQDHRVEKGKNLEPYARFDSDLERFCCCHCGEQFETYRGIDTHLATSSVCVS